jgi:hypothetical protein
MFATESSRGCGKRDLVQLNFNSWIDDEVNPIERCDRSELGSARGPHASGKERQHQMEPRSPESQVEGNGGVYVFSSSSFDSGLRSN